MLDPPGNLDLGQRRDRRRVILAASLAAALASVAIVSLLIVLRPLPPRTITLATGPEGSAYAEFAKRYQELLAQEGVRLTLVPTAGGVDNLARLRDPRSGIQLGFVEWGIPSDGQNLVSLGTLCYDPVWFFTRSTVVNRGFMSLTNLRIAIGPEGSDSRALSLKLLELNRANSHSIQLLTLTPEAAAKDLLRGRIDAATLVMPWESSVVQQLVKADNIKLLGFPRADAYVALFPFLNKLVVPMGVGDLGKNLPPQDVNLIATKTSLIVRKDLHPALQYLLLETAAQIHSKAGIFQKAGQFPAPEAMDIPLSPHARHYYKSGRPLLQRYLPFWMAALAEEALVLALPLLGVAYPVANGLAGLYQWGVKRRIFLIYGELSLFDLILDKMPPREQREEYLAKLRNLEQRADRLRVPQGYMSMLYTLKDHISLVRARLERP